VTHGAIVDHIKPKAEGGTDDLENLQAICRPCHVKKTALESGRGRSRAAMPGAQRT
jgi:5-methylcytosine-specific restriction protein A